MNQYIVKCDNCTRSNRLAPYDINKDKPKCGVCGGELSNEQAIFLSIKLEDVLPAEISLAARNYYYNVYVNDDREKEKQNFDTPRIGPIWRLIESFGQVSMKNEAYYRLLWLCYNLIREVEYLWLSMTENRPIVDFMEKLSNYLKGGEDQNTLSKYCLGFKPTRNGLVVRDCDSCALESIASACANTSNFIFEYNPEYIEDVIIDTWNVIDERAFTICSNSFERWIASIAVIYSYQMKRIPNEKHLLWMPEDKRKLVLGDESSEQGH